MEKIEQIITSKDKPKAKVEAIAQLVKSGTTSIETLIAYFNTASSTVIKGSLIEAIEFVTKESPSIISKHIDFIINNITFDAPKVKWETARVIGNIAHEFTEKVVEAIPHLMKNSSDSGTVVRWSAAFALTEIAKNNALKQDELQKEFERILKVEENSGVRNVYLKAIKQIQKKQSNS